MMKRQLYVGGCLFLALICLFMIIACNNNKYNATLYDDAQKWIAAEFIKENLTGGAFYEDEQVDNSLPTSKAFLIKDEDEMKTVFNNSFDLEVNFENQMIIVYTFTSIYHRKCDILKMNMENDTLRIIYKVESKSGVGDASRPYQRWFVITMDILPLNSIEFEEKN